MHKYKIKKSGLIFKWQQGILTMMIKIIANFLTIALFLSFGTDPVGAQIVSSQGGKMAVYINPAQIGGDYPNAEGNLSECLRTHLDYYLWHKGWDFEFIFPKNVISLDSAQNEIRGNSFRFLLFINIKAQLKIHEFDLPDRIVNDSSRVYSDRLKIKLSASLIDLATGEKILPPIEEEVSAEKNWRKSLNFKLNEKNYLFPEPPDFVIKRLISASFKSLPESNFIISPTDNNVPLKIVIDSQIAVDSRDFSDAMMSIKYILHSIYRQFGCTLKIIDTVFIGHGQIQYSDIQNLYNLLETKIPPLKDTFTVVFVRTSDAPNYYEPDFNLPVGLSEIGRKTSLVTEIPSPNEETSEWKSFLNGQLILHEVGHLFGAIHVSDINSVMNSRVSWVSSDNFDSLNKSLIKMGFQDNSKLAAISSYLRLVVLAIEQTEYKLSDYPELFFSYNNYNKRNLTSNLGNTTFAGSIRYASDGYAQYLIKNKHRAKELFYMALAGDPMQGAIHYYLAKVTDGELSRYHLARSAQIGYYAAIREYNILRK
jgi:hypothetical protein